jgi:hypothetical protein
LFQKDIHATLSVPHHGRTWTLYTDRQTHYDFLGFDERLMLREFLNSKGCRESDRQSFPQVGVAAWDCP